MLKSKFYRIKKSVFFYRTLALVLAAVIVTSLISATLYMLVSRNQFVRIRGDELIPVARSISYFIHESDDPYALMHAPFFRALTNENTNFVDATIYAFDKDGEVIIYNSGNTLGRAEPEPNKNGEREAPVNDVPAAAQSPAPSAEAGTDNESPPPVSPPSPAPIDPEAFDRSGPPGAPFRGFDFNNRDEDIQVDPELLQAAFQMVERDGEITDILVSQSDLDYLVVGVPIVDDTGGFDGAVIISKRISELSEQLEGMNVALIVGALVTCILMIFPAAFMGVKLTDPIREIQQVARAMSNGDFSQRASEKHSGEIGELAVAINEFAEKSEALEQTRRDYVANISHELRTPIASIRAMSETLHDGLLTDEVKKQRYYDHILRESMRLTRLVDDLLELSRLQSGGVALERSVTDLLPALESSAITFERLAEESGIDFRFKRPHSLPPVLTNTDRIEQILIILIDNAIKHTPDDGQVTLSAAVDGDVVKITVSDTGEGISQEDIPRVFERFFMSDKSHSGSGTGLGLSIAKEVLELMGESIWVQSRLGEGSDFTFTVHIAKNEDSK